MNLFRKIAINKTDLIVGIFVFGISVAMVTISRISRLYNARAISSSQPVAIYLHHPTGLDSLAYKFQELGVIKNEDEMIWAGKLLGWKHFRAGRYEIDGDYSYDVLLSKFARGIQDPVSVTILPGITQKRLEEELSHKLRFDTTAVRKAFQDSVFLAKLGMTKQEVFGRMLPNTYKFYWNSTPEQIIRRIVNVFNKKVQQSYAARLDTLRYSMNEILTMASIVEWEAQADSEKAIISGLYWNRLKRGMYLQADPTVNYAIGERRRLLYEDYKVDNPYNTYVNKGLPPGPITNPSLISIKAALFPDDNDYLYMVASPNGTHVFSETFAQHKRESEKWRRWLQKQYRIKRQREREAQQKAQQEQVQVEHTSPSRDAFLQLKHY